MAEGQLTAGTGTTITLAANDRVVVDCQQGAQAALYAGTAPAGAPTSVQLAKIPGGRAVFGPYGAGTVFLGAIGGTVDFQSGTEASLSAGVSKPHNVMQLTANQIASPSAALLADKVTTYTGPNSERMYSDGTVLKKAVLTGTTTGAVAGTAAVTVANLLTGVLVFTGGAGTQTLPTASAISAVNGAVQGTVVDFVVDNTAGSGTCTVAVNTGIVAATPIITGGATLTIANSATQGIGLFRLVFSSASAAVLFRIG